MSEHIERFLLKDHLLNREKVSYLASEIYEVFPGFDRDGFVEKVVGRFPELELKARISWISEVLFEFLPSDFCVAVSLLLESLPAPCDPLKTDDDFGDFIYAAYAEFVAVYGCQKETLVFSLNALKEITKRFSVEFAIRSFINAFPDETLAELVIWSRDDHYHVRRLVSEGTRPKLPWAQKVLIAPSRALPLLDGLFFDSTRFVTRSVANHLNDISKIDPELVLSTLDRWKKTQKQSPKEMDFMIKHALRTLVKNGHEGAISFLDFSPNPDVIVSSLDVKASVVKIGDSVEFSFLVMAQKNERLIVDYVIYFRNKTGDLAGSKVFKLKQLEMMRGQAIRLSKRHLFRAGMTTRPLFQGEHRIEIQINGKTMGGVEFFLEV
jgi:3-methyladenine DNA glycosylase AlkC